MLSTTYGTSLRSASKSQTLLLLCWFLTELSEGNGFVLRDFITVSATTRGTDTFWGNVCGSIPIETHHLVIALDYSGIKHNVRPKTGATWCRMLRANHLHDWSQDGVTWTSPSPHDDPRNNGGGALKIGGTVVGMPFWGTDAPLSGGCCHPSPHPNDWGQGFKMWAAVPTTTMTSSSTSSSFSTTTSVSISTTSVSFTSSSTSISSTSVTYTSISSLSASFTSTSATSFSSATTTSSSSATTIHSSSITTTTTFSITSTAKFTGSNKNPRVVTTVLITLVAAFVCIIFLLFARQRMLGRSQALIGNSLDLVQNNPIEMNVNIQAPQDTFDIGFDENHYVADDTDKDSIPYYQ
eukprot:m.343552 g.343552  ORF g.343552 m.343552 type:complete len:352 (-) comp22998_c0_seq1:66-1121(-)